jgi:hypothetical protein
VAGCPEGRLAEISRTGRQADKGASRGRLAEISRTGRQADKGASRGRLAEISRAGRQLGRDPRRGSMSSDDGGWSLDEEFADEEEIRREQAALFGEGESPPQQQPEPPRDLESVLSNEPTTEGLLRQEPSPPPRPRIPYCRLVPLNREEFWVNKPHEAFDTKVRVPKAEYHYLKNLSVEETKKIWPAVTGYTDEDHISLTKTLDRFFAQRTVEYPDYIEVTERYRPSRNGFAGRVYAPGPGLVGCVRSNLYRGTRDMDMKCGIQTVMTWLARMYGVDVKNIEFYMKNRDGDHGMLRRVVDEEVLSGPEAKQLAITTLTSDKPIASKRGVDGYIRKLDADAKRLQKALTEVPELQGMLPFCKEKGDNQEGSFMTHLYHFVESKLALAVKQRLQVEDVEVAAVVYDGLNVYSDRDDLLDIAAAACEEVAPGIGMQWGWKELDFRVKDNNKNPILDAAGNEVELRVPSDFKLPETKRKEVAMPVMHVLTSWSPRCADPGSKMANMDHVRNGMMLDCNPARTGSDARTFYKWTSPVSKVSKSNKVEYDGSIHCFMDRASGATDGVVGLEAVHDRVRALATDKSPSGWHGIELSVHAPVQRLCPETDDRASNGIVLNAASNFCVTEEKYLVSGRHRWRMNNPGPCLLNTEFALVIAGIGKIIFAYDSAKPFIEKDGERFNVTDPQAFHRLLDFTRYDEGELAKQRPANCLVAKTAQLLAACNSKSGSPACLAALISHIGPRLAYERGQWYTWSHGGWRKDDDDTNVKTMLRAAATELKQIVFQIAYQAGFASQWNKALDWFGLQEDAPDDGGSQPDDPKKVATGSSFLPTSERGLSMVVSQILPWAMETGFSKSFEDNRDLGFLNGVQQMTPPYAFHPSTPADRVMVQLDCDLPADEADEADGGELLLSYLLPLFNNDEGVAKRERDKIACLLSGTCTVLHEANFRPLMGPYNPHSGRYATRVGKSTFFELLGTLLGKAFKSNYPASFLAMVKEPGRNYSFFKDVEWQLAHGIDEAEAKRSDSTSAQSIREWGATPKQMWTGSAPPKFSYKCEFKEEKSVLLRSNALYISANKFNIGAFPDIWSKVEATPFPCVGDIPENKDLIEAGVPKFEVDSGVVDSIRTMDNETRGKILRYTTNRCIAIMKDPAVAAPPTEKHRAAKAQLKEVAGGDGDVVASEEHACVELEALVEQNVHACMPKDSFMDAYDDNLDLAEKRKTFQKKGPRCFCHKPAAEACSFSVSDFAALLKDRAPASYVFFVKKEGQISKLAAAVQEALGLDVDKDKPGFIPQVYGKPRIPRSSIFGFTLGEKPAGDASSSTPPFPTPRHEDAVEDRKREREVETKTVAKKPKPSRKARGKRKETKRPAKPVVEKEPEEPEEPEEPKESSDSESSGEESSDSESSDEASSESSSDGMPPEEN